MGEENQPRPESGGNRDRLAEGKAESYAAHGGAAGGGQITIRKDDLIIIFAAFLGILVLIQLYLVFILQQSVIEISLRKMKAAQAAAATGKGGAAVEEQVDTSGLYLRDLVMGIIRIQQQKDQPRLVLSKDQSARIQALIPRLEKVMGKLSSRQSDQLQGDFEVPRLEVRLKAILNRAQLNYIAKNAALAPPNTAPDVMTALKKALAAR